MGSKRGDLRADHRLHPLSWLFLVASTAKSLVVPLIFVFFASGGSGMTSWTRYVPWASGYEIYALILLVPASIAAAIKQLIFRYGFGDEELVVRDGLLTRNERHIPYGRIQNVDLVRNPFHRWLKVAQVRLETASGSKPEAVMRVLSMDAVETLRAHVFAERREAEAALPESAPERADHEIVRLSTGDVVRYGLVDNRGMVVVGAFVGLLWQLGFLDENTDFDVDSWMTMLPDWLVPGAEAASWVGPLLAAVGLFVVAFVLLRLLSVALALFRLHHFTVRRQGDDLRTEFGLFTRITATIPRPRIQLLSIQDSWLMRRFGRVSVQVETAGAAGGGEDGEDGGGKLPKTRWIAPLLPAGRLPEILAETLPAVAWDALDWQPLSAGAERRLRKRSLIWALLSSVPFYFLSWIAGLLVTVVFAAWAWLHARWWVRHTGWATDGQTVAYRSGWWRRKLSIVPLGKVQSVQRKTNPFDRRRAMARLAVDTAGAGRAGHRVAIPYLDDVVAVELRDRLYYEASERAFRW